jgi:ketosteroid isomerase-like protein
MRILGGRMSRDNVEIVRRGYKAFNRGDLEEMVADFAPEFEYETTGMIPGEGGVYRGPDGWREFVGWMGGEFESPRVDITELIEVGERVLAALTLRGYGKRSGVEASWDIWHLWTVRDGKIVHGQGFTRREEALIATGLEA